MVQSDARTNFTKNDMFKVHMMKIWTLKKCTLSFASEYSLRLVSEIFQICINDYFNENEGLILQGMHNLCYDCSIYQEMSNFKMLQHCLKCFQHNLH